MGLLAETRRRKRISRDPNNTKWSRNANMFGQKILRAQGWQPGQCLGDQNASHSQLHTAANVSGIRISVKDDIKGLGFNKFREDEITGLDVFSDLLSRLNGKSTDSIEEEKQARLMKTNAYLESKWGPVRFVKGGFLLGEIREAEDNENDTCEMQREDDAELEGRKHDSSRTEKKRKASSIETDGPGSDAKKRAKRRKEENRMIEKESSSASPATCGPQVSSKKSRETKVDKKSKKMRKQRRDRSYSIDDSEYRSERTAAADDGIKTNSDEEKAKGKTSSLREEATVVAVREKTKVKAERRKSSKRTPKSAEVAEGEQVPEAKDKASSLREEAATVAVKEKTKVKAERKKGSKRTQKSAEAAEGEQVPRTDNYASTDVAVNPDASTTSGTSTGTSTPTNVRNLVRSRFIAAKRQAMLDPSALKQIFMITT